MTEIKLSKRLSTAASFVRSGAFVADIGTDHAYLPIYLVQKGIAIKAHASDVNNGPILKAKENILNCGLTNLISTGIANGLMGIESFSPSDIVICGMGGELIAQILDASDYVKNKDIRLILQPMTSIYELRTYLSNGFDIIDERVVCEDEKIYQVICAHYDGQKHNYSEIELELGKHNIERRDDEFLVLLNAFIKKKIKRCCGLRLGGYDTTEIEEEIKELERMKNDI